MKFTIFTPTYNRAYILPKLYDSLKSQSYKDFEWLIVDDGSEDDTKNIVKNWIEEGRIKIRYIYKENSGKQKTYNVGIKNALGEFFICIDSDDQYTEDALEKIQGCWNKIESKEKYAGVCYLSMTPDHKLIGTEFPENRMDSNHFEIYHKYKVKGDKGLMLKTDILREYLFPEIENEKFITEALLYNRIGRKYKIRYINRMFEIKEYYPDGLTAKYALLLRKNPKGSLLYYNEINYFKLNFIEKILNNAVYIKFSIFAKKGIKGIFKDSLAMKFILIMAFPIGVLMYIKEKNENFT